MSTRGYAPTVSTDSTDSTPGTTSTDTHTPTAAPDATNLRPVTTDLAPTPDPALLKGIERLPEAAIQALLGAVDALPLVSLAQDLRAAEGRLRARYALSLAMEACECVSQLCGGADSADSADSEVPKCL